MGKKKQPVYKLVAADARSPRDGRFIEAIGFYNPQTDPATIEIKEERANYWLSVGAQPTDTVKNLLSKKGILLERDLKRQGMSEDKVALKMDEWSKDKEAKLAAADKKKAEKKAKVEAEKEEAKAEAEKEEAKVEEKEEIKEEVEAPEAKAEETEPEVKGTASEETQAEENEEK